MFANRTKDQSWGDDLESLGYMFVYFARGSLPWQGLKAATDDEKLELIKQKKISLSGEELCQDLLPTEFARYINYTRSLDPRDKPNYRYIRNSFAIALSPRVSSTITSSTGLSKDFLSFMERVAS